MTSTRNPASRAADRASKWFCSAAETIPKNSHPPPLSQVHRLARRVEDKCQRTRFPQHHRRAIKFINRRFGSTVVMTTAELPSSLPISATIRISEKTDIGRGRLQPSAPVHPAMWPILKQEKEYHS